MNRTLLKSLFLSSEESRDLAGFLAQERGIIDYENMSNDELSRALKASENKDNTRIEKIREEIKKLSHKFSRQELKEIRNDLYEIKNKKGCLKSKKTKNNLNKLEERIYKLNRYYDYDDVKYRGIRDIKDLLDLSISEDYYKPIIVNTAFNNNYIRYESKGDKGEWKIQLTAEFNFISSIPDSDETRMMHTKSDNLEIMIGSGTDEVIEDLFKSLLQRYQEGLEEKMKGSEFVFDGVNVLYYDFNKISLNRGGSYIKSPAWLSSKKATINPQNKKDDMCFQYALTIALNYEKINNNHQRISKIEPFIDQYNWNEIDFPSTGKDWKNFESNNTQLLLIFYMCLIILKKYVMRISQNII